MITPDIGVMMRQRMTTLNLRQVDLAHALGTSQTAVSLILNGKRRPRYGTLERLCEVLDVQILFLAPAPHESPADGPREPRVG